MEILTEVTGLKTYKAAMSYLNEVVDYATQNGYLPEQGSDNKYTREIGRIGVMCADYESVFMKFNPTSK